MKRTISSVLALISISVLFPTSAAMAEPARPGVAGGVFRSADIAWTRRINGDMYMYFAGASTFANSANPEMRTRAWADRTKCAELKTKRIKIIACSGSVRAKKVSSDRFQMDPAMESATLDFQGNRVRWQGQDFEQPWVLPFADPSFGAFAYTSADRWANATGRVLGTKFRGTRWSDFGLMSTGGYAFAWITTPLGRYRLDEHGTVHYRFRFEQRV